MLGSRHTDSTLCWGVDGDNANVFTQTTSMVCLLVKDNKHNKLLYWPVVLCPPHWLVPDDLWASSRWKF